MRLSSFGRLLLVLLVLIGPACSSSADDDDDDDNNGGASGEDSGGSGSGKGGSSGSGGSGGSYADKGDFVFEWGDNSGFEDASTWAMPKMQPQEEALNGLFKLASDITVLHTTCGFVNAFWDNESSITLCYEMLDFEAQTFASSGLATTQEELDALVFYTWVFIFYHELGHGLIDTYDLPVPGREEDAVDSFSTVVLVEAGVPDAVVSAALFWALLEQQGGSGMLDFADEHSMNLQRFYNLLCWVYGSDPNTYAYLVNTFPDLEPRIAGGRCEQEYADQADAWQDLLTPFVK